MELVKRLKEPTPKFWKKVQKIALVLTAIGGAIATAPVSLPATLVTIGGYLATAGAVGASLAQLTSEKK